MKLAIFGDIHGNHAPFPNQVTERIRAAQIPTIMGNYDDGTGVERDECGCAYRDPVDRARACWALIDTAGDVSVELVRLPYPIEQTTAAIRASELPHEFADALETGGRSGAVVS